MIGLLYFLIFGRPRHIHKWKTTEKADLYNNSYAIYNIRYPIGQIWYQECETCGKVQRKKLS